ncbi:MAG TPA: DNRLRE domain-containing protein [Phycisphaerae bacterium]|nr:DNRLRE domain-containing protein [Phycisphaerae bacterium]
MRLGFCVLSALLCICAAQAAPNDWAEGTHEQADGASRDYYNRAGLLKWQNLMGDWRDAADTPQGAKPYARARIVDDDTAKPVEWDVTALVGEWLAGKHPNQGFFLRSLGGTFRFRSREYADKAARPQLVLTTADGTVTLAPEADTYLDRSTYRSQGNSDTLLAGHALVRFDLSAVKAQPRIAKAVLRLHTYAQYGSGEVVVLRCSQGHDLPPSDPIPGLAEGYRGDRGIAKDPNVIFFADFESDSWADAWTFARGTIDTVGSDPERRFKPLLGKACRVKIAEGNTGAMNVGYQFKKQTGAEPEEIFFRYYLRLGDDWNQTLQGGKMPGISGTYGVAGWGGRKSDGTNGWSARGSFMRSIPKGNPLGGMHPIGTYCYHADQPGTYGDIWPWQKGYRGYLVTNRWYSVEQYLKMNTPGEKDGVLRAWIDGRPAFEKTDIRFRKAPHLKIEQIWMNVYHGGKKPSPRDQHLFIDNVVIARGYIGPMKGAGSGD